ncbi:MAG: FAD-binding protein [Planctomycetota bacterium]
MDPQTTSDVSPAENQDETDLKPIDFPESLQHIVRENEPLAPMLWVGIGGPARYLAEPVDWNQVIELVTFARGNGLAVRVLGEGSNVLVREAGFDGLVISLASAATSSLEIVGDRLIAGAGARLTHAVIKTAGEGLGGLEHLVGLPGSIGGAIVGNISAEGRDIGSTVHSIDALDENGQEITLSGEEAGFGHRSSTLVGLVVLRVTCQLEPKDARALTKRMQKLWIHRNNQRPTSTSRLAMPFVDPDTISATELIQQTGLAGIREGDVSLDSTRPNYLLLHDGATSEQCVTLIQRVREQVAMQSGIDLQLNLRIW